MLGDLGNAFRHSCVTVSVTMSDTNTYIHVDIRRCDKVCLPHITHTNKNSKNINKYGDENYIIYLAKTINGFTELLSILQGYSFRLVHFEWQGRFIFGRSFSGGKCPFPIGVLYHGLFAVSSCSIL